MRTHLRAVAAVAAAAALTVSLSVPAIAAPASSSAPGPNIPPVMNGGITHPDYQDGTWYQVAALATKDLLDCFADATLTQESTSETAGTWTRACTSITGQRSTTVGAMDDLTPDDHKRFEVRWNQGPATPYHLVFRSEEDGKLMILASSDGRSAAVYSRTPVLDSVRWQREIVPAATYAGWNPCQFIATPQPGGPAPLPVCVL
ncbi:hypothetical protein C1Y63_05330 [Corynebacterium sp. 13CS0277]|uniref:lipocalin family protein n=1 Tax=Corynebacterium sp. 13CS0277 TaxID=2071994 RepID=UPI000D02E645|nr:lipocalin family protein [Corynebacterium sp. 13CS0277]PRQ11604.1 hypothetical protein C1Y63_05330 [Corynebacterium sp. 13CS0277]